jgi:hypothetical protein
MVAITLREAGVKSIRSQSVPWYEKDEFFSNLLEG